MDKNSWLILILKEYYTFFIIILLPFFGIIPFYYLPIIYLIFCIYHRLTSKTEFLYTPNSEMQTLLTKSNILSSKFIPDFFFPTTPLQFLNLSRTKIQNNYKISVHRENIGKNGVCLDWVKYEEINTENSPILIIFPGLTGSIKDTYIFNIINESITKGKFNTCIYQMRLLNENVNIDKKYLFLIDDIDEALNEIIKKNNKNKKIFAIGFSYGANQLVKYLGQKNNKIKKINAAVSISNPFEIIVCTRLSRDKIYDRLLIEFFKKVLLKTKKNIEKIGVDTDKVLKTNSMTEVGNLYSAKVFGYTDVDDYYRGVSCVLDVKNVNVPLLCLNAKDDKICFEESFPYEEIIRNKNIGTIWTSHGTHNCFIEHYGLFGVKQWAPAQVINFLKAVSDNN